jgi:hypothetical protein
MHEKPAGGPFRSWAARASAACRCWGTSTPSRRTGTGRGCSTSGSWRWRPPPSAPPPTAVEEQGRRGATSRPPTTGEAGEGRRCSTGRRAHPPISLSNRSPPARRSSPSPAACGGSSPNPAPGSILTTRSYCRGRRRAGGAPAAADRVHRVLPPSAQQIEDGARTTSTGELTYRRSGRSSGGGPPHHRARPSLPLLPSISLCL